MNVASAINAGITLHRLRGCLGTAVFLSPLLLSLLIFPSDQCSGIEPTPSEITGFNESPSWKETQLYLRDLAKASDHIRLASVGSTTEGRPITAIFVHHTGDSPLGWGADRSKPILLINAGIHSGEICGNDALQLFLKEVAEGKHHEITHHLRLILIPIFNIDGHVRNSIHNRFTQNGPDNGFGTRRNALRLDLNRDFAKLETPECQALVKLGTQYRPHVFVDLHTNDGFDYQYQLLFGIAVDPTLPGNRDSLVRHGLSPYIVSSMKADGYLSHPIGWPRDRLDLTKGIATYGFGQRYGTGAFESMQAISILSEAHPYIPYDERVGATYSLLRAIFEYAVDNADALVETVDSARAETMRWAGEPGVHEVALGCRANLDQPMEIEWLGKPLDVVTSPITGRKYAQYRHEPMTYRLPFFDQLIPGGTATMPRGYLILPAWAHVVKTLHRHGIEVDTLKKAHLAEVDAYRVKSVEFIDQPYQGHLLVDEIEFDIGSEQHLFPVGTYWVGLDQPAGLTAMRLLEAESPDALLRWNAFDTIFERGIILERWALEENAKRLMEDPEIRAEYEAALDDSAFANDPRAKLEFFFQKTPFVEDGEKLYPVFRILGEAPAR